MELCNYIILLTLQIQIFRATKLCRRSKNLTVIISDCGEDNIEGKHLFF